GPPFEGRSASPAGSSSTATDYRTRLWRPRKRGTPRSGFRLGGVWRFRCGRGVDLFLDRRLGFAEKLLDSGPHLGAEHAEREAECDADDQFDHCAFSLQVKRGRWRTTWCSPFDGLTPGLC